MLSAGRTPMRGATQYKPRRTSKQRNHDRGRAPYPSFMIPRIPEFTNKQKIQAGKPGGRKAEALNKQTCKMQTERCKSTKANEQHAKTKCQKLTHKCQRRSPRREIKRPSFVYLVPLVSFVSLVSLSLVSCFFVSLFSCVLGGSSS